MQPDLLSFVRQDGFRVVSRSASRGGQYNGPCPFCGGTDRFRVQPAHGLYGWFACNQCGRRGSAIDYLIQRRGMSKGQALAAVGWKPMSARNERSALPAQALSARVSWDAPAVQWQKTAQAFVRRCQQILWSETGREALAYLRGRGLTETMIRQAKLGYYPREAHGVLKEWGRPVKLYQGITVPWFFDGTIWRITIRNIQVASGNDRYRQLAGGSNGLYLALSDCLRPPRPVVMTEGELDALSLAQECGNLVNVVATGTTQGSHTPRWVALLAQQERVLIAFDAEEKGDTAANWWLYRLEHAERLRPWWKDINQMLQDGADLRQWLLDGLNADLSGAPSLPSSPSVHRVPSVEGASSIPVPEKTPLDSLEEDDMNEIPHCVQCSALIEYYSDHGIPYCEVHRYQYSRAHCAASAALSHITQKDFFQLDVLLIESLFEGHSHLVIDLETTGFDPRQERIVSIALGLSGKVAILDLRPYYELPLEEQAAWRGALVRLFQHLQGVTWIGHNLKFDWQFLAHHFGVRLTRAYDTMLVEQLIHGVGLQETVLSVGLQSTAERYGITVTKEERAWFPGLHTRPQDWQAPFPTEQLRYMAQDIEAPYAIYERQQAQIEEQGLAQVAQIEHEALPALAAMQLRGVLIDTERWRAILERKQARKLALEPELVATLSKALSRACETYQHALHEQERRWVEQYQAVSGKMTYERFRKERLAEWKKSHQEPPAPEQSGTINLASAAQVQAALSVLGIQVPSTKEADLEPYARDYPVVGKLLEWKALEKSLSAFGENLLAKVGPDGRLRTDYAQIGAVSGRIISRNPNLQQIPAKDTEEENLRHCFIAPPGYCILTADLSNIELRILAEVSNDQTMLRMFAEGKDLHEETARLMFGLPPDTDTRTYLYKGQVPARKVAKTINFGLVYGMGAQGLANRAGVTLAEAKELIQTYFRTYNGVASWLRATAREAMQRGVATTLAGRKRRFVREGSNPGPHSPLRAMLERSAKNHPIQGTNADILKRAMKLLSDALPPEAHLILTVHDELVVESPEALVPVVERCMQECMVRACRDFLTTVHIPLPDVVKAAHWKKE